MFAKFGNIIMSKIAKKPILIPEGIDVKINDGSVTVKGPKGELSNLIPDGIEIEIKNRKLKVYPADKKSRDTSSLWGLTWVLIRNMIEGTGKGFSKVLEFQGVGYKAAVKMNDLELSLGYSHPVIVSAPEGISFKAEKNSITVSGIDKELVGRVAADIRSKRKPEPYKGSGIRYQGEIIKRKAGKKAVAAG